MKPFDYLEPTSLPELVELLGKHREKAKLLAGGTDLIIHLQMRKAAPDVIIAMNRVPELTGIQANGKTSIGAMATLREVETHAALIEKFPFLAYSAGQVGSVQVRNLGTLVGNLTNAAPSADTVPALYVTGAQARIVGPNGDRTIPVEKVMTGPGKTSLAPDEVLVDLTIPDPPPGFRGVYLKHCIRMAMDLAVVGVAASVVRSGDKCDDVKIALGAVAPTVIHAESAEKVLRGKTVTPELIEQAAAAAANDARPISDIRASAEYRRDMVAALTRKALRQLCA